ncbi:MAG: TlyA family RNA methyltransferase [Clostridia bacterium]|nr:TlyA family RNA methyltransferase [Clostridia bacterium]
MRLDLYLAEEGLVSSRARAKQLILAGAVTLDGRVVDKPSFEVTGSPVIAVQDGGFVSRGGEKLAAALDAFGIDPRGMRAIDIGASTGGFTDCLLSRGASRVVAIDSGAGQLHPSLLRDGRVINIEHFNARELASTDVGHFDLAVMDVSFISQTLILPRIVDILTPTGIAVTLIKPQFEAGRAALNKKGIVKSPRDRIFAIRRVLTAAAEASLTCVGLAVSPITGGDGNIEYLACFAAGGDCARNAAFAVEKLVMEGGVYR